MLDNKKSYSFDFDSNLVFTQDTIFLLKWNWKSWYKIELSQQEFDSIHVDNIHWRWINDNPADSLINFLKSGNYKKALLQALISGKTWPGRWSFVDATINASPIAKITARWQEPDELKDSHRTVIYDFLSIDQRKDLIENMQKRLKVKLKNEQAIDLYLNNNLYLPVESQQFLDNFAISTDMPVKTRKNFAFEKFVWHVQALFWEYYWTSFINNPRFSVWFSDDNLQNVQSMTNFIQSVLLSKYPLVDFVIYDTNDFKNVKKFKITV